MSAHQPEHKPGIFDPLTEPELFHNRLMDILAAAEINNPDVVDFECEPEAGELSMWLHVTGRQDEDEIMVLSADGKLKYISAYMFRSDDYEDAPALGREADGTPAPIMLVDHMAELTRRTIEVLYDVKDRPVSMDNYDDEPVVYRNGWQVTYDINDGWSLHFWKGVDPEVAGKPENWAEPTQEDLDTLKQILERAERVAGRK